MRARTWTHVSNQDLLRDLAEAAAQDRAAMAMSLAYIAEFDARQLYLKDGYCSMRAYLVDELHWCEDEADERVHAARMAYRFPAIFPALAEGRLTLAAVTLLAPHLSSENAEELLKTVEYKTESEIVPLLAARFPRSG